MSAYLATQTSHLQDLHRQLGLPSTELASDEARIEAIVKAAIQSFIEDRERQVEDWKRKIERLENGLEIGRKAVGKRGREIDLIVKSWEDDSLPRRYARLLEGRDELFKIYQQRLDIIKENQATLQQLATLLGAIEPPPPLIPVAGQSLPKIQVHNFTTTRSNEAGSSSSNTTPQPVLDATDVAIAANPLSTIGEIQNQTEETIPEGGGIWLDVSESVTEALHMAIQAANDERVNRLKSLINLFRNLTWLHYELILPPLPLSITSSSSSSTSTSSATSSSPFPQHLLPQPKDGLALEIYDSYLKRLKTFMSANPDAAQPAPDVSEGDVGNVEDDGEEIDIEQVKGMDGVEPEIGLMLWAEEIDDLWANEKLSREARIQELYDQIEPLWTRMGEEQDYIDVFIDSNRGSGEATIRAYETELERVLEIRRSSLSQFILSARAEIETLSNELMMSEDEKAEFGAFIDDDYTETLLILHEEEVNRLRAEIESKAPVLPKVREWHVLMKEEAELEVLEKDPNRFSRRGGGMLKEEKLRKRVGVLKPKIEADLMRLLPAWEGSSGRAFTVHGIRVVDQILDALEAKEAAKEARKRAKSGLAPTPLPKIQQTPSANQRSTSFATSRSRALPTQNSTMSSRYPSSTNLGTRKREAPTPTPFGNGNGNGFGLGLRLGSNANDNPKRQKIGSSLKPLQPVRGGGGGGVGNLHYSTSSSLSSPTPAQRTFTGQSSVSVLSNASVNSYDHHPSGGKATTITTTSLIPVVKYGLPSSSMSLLPGGKQLGKTRRQSFKPRQSVSGGIGMGIGLGLPGSMGLGIGMGMGCSGDEWGRGVMEEQEQEQEDEEF